MVVKVLSLKRILRKFNIVLNNKFCSQSTEFNMKSNLKISCNLQEISEFLKSLNLEHNIYLDTEGVTFYISNNNILIDLIILDNKYHYYCKINNKEYFADNVDILLLKEDIIFRNFL